MNCFYFFIFNLELASDEDKDKKKSKKINTSVAMGSQKPIQKKKTQKERSQMVSEFHLNKWELTNLALDW